MKRLILLLILCAAALPSATLDDATRELSRRILARLGAPERIAMQTRAIPPVAPAEPGEVDRSLRDTLGRHLGVAAEPLALRVTVPSALALQILVAEFRRGEKSLLWEQDEQILDSPLSGGDGGFWVRDSERLAFVCVGVW